MDSAFRSEKFLPDRISRPCTLLSIVNRARSAGDGGTEARCGPATFLDEDAVRHFGVPRSRPACPARTFLKRTFGSHRSCGECPGCSASLVFVHRVAVVHLGGALVPVGALGECAAPPVLLCTAFAMTSIAKAVGRPPPSAVSPDGRGARRGCASDQPPDCSCRSAVTTACRHTVPDEPGKPARSPTVPKACPARIYAAHHGVPGPTAPRHPCVLHDRAGHRGHPGQEGAPGGQRGARERRRCPGHREAVDPDPGRAGRGGRGPGPPGPGDGRHREGSGSLRREARPRGHRPLGRVPADPARTHAARRTQDAARRAGAGRAGRGAAGGAPGGAGAARLLVDGGGAAHGRHLPGPGPRFAAGRHGVRLARPRRDAAAVRGGRQRHRGPADRRGQDRALPPVFRPRIGTGTGNGRDVQLWRTVWPATGRDGFPPVALVFTKNVGKLAMQTRMHEVGELARDHWRGGWDGDGRAREGERPDGYRDYGGKVPLLATTLRLLATHGPHGPVWWRYGHSTWQSLGDALDNPDDFRAYSVRAEARRAAAEAERERGPARAGRTPPQAGGGEVGLPDLPALHLPRGRPGARRRVRSLPELPSAHRGRSRSVVGRPGPGPWCLRAPPPGMTSGGKRKAAGPYPWARTWLWCDACHMWESRR